MDNIFRTIEPKEVIELMEEMFTGYINSPLCAPMMLGQMYELKRIITLEAKEYENRQPEAPGEPN